MMKDQFANYVVQKILEISNDKQREVLLNWIRAHLHSLKKYTYGKHIVGLFEQLSGEGACFFCSVCPIVPYNLQCSIFFPLPPLCLLFFWVMNWKITCLHNLIA